MKTPVVLYEEIQYSGKMKNKWFFGIIALIFGVILLLNFFSKKETPLFSGFLWSGFIIFILLQVFSTISFQLITQIRDDGIYVRFRPYQPSFTRFSWEAIEEIHIRKFDPLKEYGYGIRSAPGGKGYTVPGNTGIYLVLKNQTTVMISTGNPEQVVEVLKKLGRMK